MCYQLVSYHTLLPSYIFIHRQILTGKSIIIDLPREIYRQIKINKNYTRGEWRWHIGRFFCLTLYLLFVLYLKFIQMLIPSNCVQQRVKQCNEKTTFPFPFKSNGIWLWWQFFFQFWTKWNSIWFRKSKGKPSPQAFPIQWERKWECSFLSAASGDSSVWNWLRFLSLKTENFFLSLSCTL